MPLCCSKKAAQRQKEYEEEVRMRKLEEAARQEQEHREREQMRKAEIERIMQEEQQSQAMLKLAEEKAMQERLAQEQAELERIRQQEENERLEREKMLEAEEQQPSRLSSGRASSIAASQHTHDHSEAADESFEMQTYTPFDMTTVDQTARYMATKCGCAMKPTHKPSECPICTAIDLSDAPLIV
ncbi:putative gliding-associated protein 45 [Babesia divergens]|uniref:Gliding-associated protein 45 n=1 Tax=Babesia divergens TaxID=32595 RepID=A0AAD9LLK8_BABDI|nr:putative gliding-associated protein 45 [Babesia divergens]